MLIASLPKPHLEDLVRFMTSHPLVDAVRFNTGIPSHMNELDTLRYFQKMAVRGEKLFIPDIKGRQLRVTRWANQYGNITLNREMKVDLPARIVFRGGFTSKIVQIHGKRIYIDPEPEQVGEGQSVNISGERFRVTRGYLSDQCRRFLKACRELGIWDIALSFVEQMRDLEEVWEIHPDACPRLKIESRKGIEFVRNLPVGVLDRCSLIAARDDMLENMGDNKAEIIPVLQSILFRDPEAVVASQIFGGLEHRNTVSAADISDVRFLQELGFKNFMLSDGISHRHLPKAMEAWKGFVELYPFTQY